MKKLFCSLLLAAMTASTGPVSASVIHVVFDVKITGNSIDGAGLFGAAGGNLFGQSAIVDFSFNTATAQWLLPSASAPNWLTNDPRSGNNDHQWSFIHDAWRGRRNRSLHKLQCDFLQQLGSGRHRRPRSGSGRVRWTYPHELAYAVRASCELPSWQKYASPVCLLRDKWRSDRAEDGKSHSRFSDRRIVDHLRHIRRARARHLGDDDPRLRWRWLHGISPEIKAGVEGRLVRDHMTGI